MVGVAEQVIVTMTTTKRISHRCSLLFGLVVAAGVALLGGRTAAGADCAD
jgi:hypothetical protein